MAVMSATFETMPSLLKVALKGCLIVSGSFLALLGYSAAQLLFESLRSPLRSLKHPPARSVLVGNMLQLTNGHSLEMLRAWRKEHGPVFAFTAMLGQRRCVTTDNKAIAYVLANTNKYFKPEAVRFHLGYLLGDGLVTVEGDEHRYQRRGLNPAFSPGSLRDMVPSFIRKSIQLRNILLQRLGDSPSATVDMHQWSSRAALDMIGLAGFDYDFDTLALGMEGSELAAALHRLNSPRGFPLVFFLQVFIKPFRKLRFDERSRETERTRNILRSIGMGIIQRNRGDAEKGGDEKDLISLILKQNGVRAQKGEDTLSTDQMLTQIPTFIVAGHETTANAVAWALFALSQSPTIQSRLREEALSALPENGFQPDLETLNSLRYLDAVVRETLRLHAPVEVITRLAEEDDVIPLETTFKDGNGRSYHGITVKKGDHVVIPLMLLNRMKEVWGPDADDFNPDRWLSQLPSETSGIPGLWASMMTFGGGPRSCIGYKFAILEMKSLLLYLVKSFTFELAVDPNEIMHHELVVTRPMLRSQKEKGPQLPMIIRPFVA